MVPSWAALPAGEGAVAIVMEPGLAFGTGEHPTTQMCLRWLWRRRPHLQVHSIQDAQTVPKRPVIPMRRRSERNSSL